MSHVVVGADFGRITVLNRGDILHIEKLSGTLICGFSDEHHFFSLSMAPGSMNDAAPILAMAKSTFASSGRWQAKVVSTSETKDQIEKVMAAAGFDSVATSCLSSAACEAFFYCDSLRLRLREMDASPPIHATKVIEDTRRRCRVLIVDDSPTIRQLLRLILSADPNIEVGGETGDPLQAEALIRQIKPDVMTLDINMPGMDGVSLLKQLMPKFRLPTVMITAMSMDQGDMVLQALEAGAIDYIQKPSMSQIDNVAATIRDKVKAAAIANMAAPRILRQAPARARSASAPPNSQIIVALGASTGGTEALKVLLSAMPAQSPPIVIVQHIPPVFSAAFARSLNDRCAFAVKEAEDGDELIPGRALVAPGGRQMAVVKRGLKFFIQLSDGATVSGHKPSVDHLFDSVASACGPRCIGAILTGMGRDGAKGLLQIRDGGGRTIAQNKDTCVVYGMPGAAVALGAAEIERPLEDMADALLDWLDQAAVAPAGRISKAL